MHVKWYSALVLFAVAILVIGCGGPQGWRIKVVNEDGKPIEGAKVTVWQYFLPAENPYVEGYKLCDQIARGEKEPYGWEFTTSKTGTVLCKTIPTGGYRATGRTGGAVTRVGDETVTIPSRNIYTLEPGNWLAATISAEGYQPSYLVFQPNSTSGNLGTITLKKAE